MSERQLFPSPPSKIGTFGEIARIFWRTSEPGTITVTRTPESPPGFRLIESYAIVPSAGRPRYLIPLSSRAIASRSLSLYASLAPRLRKSVRSAAAAGIKLGVVQSVLRDRMHVHVREDLQGRGLADISLVQRLGQMLGEPVSAMVSLGGSGPYAKPVVQLVSDGGEPIGFVKVGWNRITHRLVTNEVRMLQLCRRAAPVTFRVPRPVSFEDWNGMKVSVVSPLPEDVRRYPSGALPSIAITREIGDLVPGGVQPLWESAYVNQLRSALHLQGAPLGTREVVDRLRRHSPHPRLRFGAWHGDWSSWNLAKRGGEVHAWDWEHGGEGVPLGFDIINFHFNDAFFQDRNGLESAIQRTRRKIIAPLGALDVPGEHVGILLALYLTELTVRAGDLLREGGVPNGRLHPRLGELLLQPDAVLGDEGW
jgi:hypothetical protein